MGDARVLVVAAMALVGCVDQNATTSQLKKRSSVDLSCPWYEVGVRSIDARTRLVEGCGKRAIYVESCETCSAGKYGTFRCNCTWLWNGTVAKAPQ